MGGGVAPATGTTGVAAYPLFPNAPLHLDPPHNYPQFELLHQALTGVQAGAGKHTGGSSSPWPQMPGSPEESGDQELR